ncbi:hypothetical protein [Nocardia tengchongensis]|uniref:hypothetical protein n=1 Tax=Nocardia tengchongensis TaxID=2055889 RepID=UPI003652A8D4
MIIITALGIWGAGFVFFSAYGLLVQRLVNGRATAAATIGQAAAWPILTPVNLIRSHTR